MDPATNPYTPGAGTQPRALAGRDRELEELGVLLQRLRRGLPDRGIVLCGLRGMGKTVLLREMARQARGRMRVSFIEARRRTDLRDAITAAALEQLAGLSIRERALGAFTRAMSLIRAVPATVAPEVQVDLDALDLLTVGRSLEADLGELFARIGALARDQEIGVAFFIDELQELPAESLSALCAAMHRTGQEELPIAFVAAGLPSLPGLLSQAKSYAERLFAYPSLGPLNDDAATTAIAAPPRAVLGDDAPAIDADAVERMVAFAAGYPMLLQAIGKHAWNRASDGRITVADVAAAEADAFDDLSRELFLARWQRATPRERDYLTAVATAGGACSSAEAARGRAFPTARLRARRATS